MKLSGVPSQRRMSGRKPQGLGQRRRLNTHAEKMTSLKVKVWTRVSKELPNVCLGGRSKLQGSWGSHASERGEELQWGNLLVLQLTYPPSPSAIPIAQRGSFALQ